MKRLNVSILLCFLTATMLTIAGCGGPAPEPGKTASSTPAPQAPSGPLVVKEVVDARLGKDPATGDQVIIGSIHGTGLRDGDKVVINSGSTFGTFYGSETWLTFSIPVSAAGGQKSFSLQVVRPPTQEQSQAFTVNIK